MNGLNRYLYVYNAPSIGMKVPTFPCIRCNERGHVDFRYLHNGRSYELEMHCETHTGGCNFYRLIDLNFHEQVGDI